MKRKRISQKTEDVLHLTIYIVLLLLFAGYEADRKTDDAAQTVASDEQISPIHYDSNSVMLRR